MSLDIDWNKATLEMCEAEYRKTLLEVHSNPGDEIAKLKLDWLRNRCAVLESKRMDRSVEEITERLHRAIEKARNE